MVDHAPAPRSSPARRLTGFVASGGIGFVVDAGVLWLGLAAGLPPWAARIPSFLCAVVATWLLNRRLTFASAAAPSVPEFLRYLQAMLLGVSVNYATFLAVLSAGGGPLGALIAASAAGMVVNYLGARRVLDRGTGAHSTPRRRR